MCLHKKFTLIETHLALGEKVMDSLAFNLGYSYILVLKLVSLQSFSTKVYKEYLPRCPHVWLVLVVQYQNLQFVFWWQTARPLPQMIPSEARALVADFSQLCLLQCLSTQLIRDISKGKYRNNLSSEHWQAKKVILWELALNFVTIDNNKLPNYDHRI